MKLKKVLILSLIILLAGCGKIKTEEETLQYARGKFGKAKIVEKKYVNDEDISYILEDEEFKFQYTCRNYIDTMGISTPATDCDFDDKYIDFIIKKLNKEHMYGRNDLSYESNIVTSGTFELKLTMQTFKEKTVELIIKEIGRVDMRGYIKELTLIVYDEQGNYKGYMSSKDYVFSVGTRSVADNKKNQAFVA